MEKKIKGTLNEWQAFWDSRKKEPHFHLTGNFVIDGSDEPGKEIVTSRVLSINGNMAETENSLYVLGWPKKSSANIMEEHWTVRHTRDLMLKLAEEKSRRPDNPLPTDF